MANDDLNRMLSAALRDAAEHAPSDDGLLTAVHRRSGRYHRRRVATTLSAVAAALAVGIPGVAAFLLRPPPAPPPAVTSLRLVEGYTAPTFPYTLPPTNGMKAPVASIESDDLVAYFEATEDRHHADTTVTVSSREPAFTGPASETPVLVRGHSGTLRTVHVEPARRLTLYWRESASRWIQVATDDTYTPQQVVNLADSLMPAAVAVQPPFRLDLSPEGFRVKTVNESTMSFVAPNGSELDVVLRTRQPLGDVNEQVGQYDATLTGRTLEVDVTDWNATLEVRETGETTISEADLVRFAAGVHILDSSNPK
ncbi:hypothetical protein ODJ79_34900 [Actinoplanes sp. KI2]|uniref:hypothetical protein n=1 Tax=Actinoplanes sp. KI2 TaxID=2983315 RepID=UPI0021D59F60|nr:hypothetical protein [Actinoplanes sp. KI2]MCU7728930.1 hypothetical protein [Actinoplanes sp. KI2]